METPTQPFAPGEPIRVSIDEAGDVHLYWGEFIKLDETGLLLQSKRSGNVQFIPRERIVTIESGA